MSLRPEISGFDITKLETLFGCKDDAVLSRLEQHYLEFWGFDDEDGDAEDKSSIAGGLDYVRKIVNGELKPTGNGNGAASVSLTDEHSDFINAIVAMAFFEHEHVPTDSNYWKSYFIDYALGIEETLPDDIVANDRDTIKSLLGFLLGRPLFGTNMESDWTTYGYLTKTEVKKLLSFFEKYPQLEQDEEAFGADLKGWLQLIADNDKDLWFFSQ